MQPGKELDLLVLDKVMDGDLRTATYTFDEWSPSEDIPAAWDVVERLKERRVIIRTGILSRDRTPIYSVAFLDQGPLEEGQLIEMEITETTLPHAICLAALKAVGVEV